MPEPGNAQPLPPSSFIAVQQLVVHAQTALQRAGLREPKYGPDTAAALEVLAVSIIAAPDCAHQVPHFTACAVPLLARTPEQQLVLAGALQGEAVGALLSVIFGEQPQRVADRVPDTGPVASEMASAAVPPFVNITSAQQASARAAGADQRPWLLDVTSRIAWFLARLRDALSPRQKRAKLLRRRVSEAASRITLVLDAVSASQATRDVRRSATRAIARSRRATRRLDVNRTLTATLRAGGEFRPVYRHRPVATEYLFLVRQLSSADFEFARMQHLLRELKEQGVFLTIYTYRADPRRVSDAFSAESAAAIGLGDLHERHPDARLVIVSEGRELVSGYTLQPFHWIDELKSWSRRALLTPLPSHSWGTLESNLFHNGFSISSSRERGLDRLDLLLGGVGPVALHDETNRGPLAPVFTASPNPTLVSEQPPSEEEQQRLLLELRLHLGRHGMAWLGVCAHFPAMSAALAWSFGQQLFVDVPDVPPMDDVFARLTALPWMRYGFMPYWSRRLVIDSLAIDERATARRVIARTVATAHFDDSKTTDTPLPAQPRGVAPLALPVRISGTTKTSGIEFDDLAIEFLAAGNREDIDPILGLTREEIDALAARRRVEPEPVVVVPPPVPVPSSGDHERRRIALVIGNAQYARSRISNSIRDAQAVSAALQRIGFDVSLVTDADRHQFRQALDEFSERARGADDAIVYYAGFGGSSAGNSYLYPISTELEQNNPSANHWIPVDDVVRALAGAKSLKLAILDTSTDGYRPRSRDALPDNIMVITASENSQALDGEIDAHSPFTNALLANMETPGLTIDKLFLLVRSEVRVATRERQSPSAFDTLTLAPSAIVPLPVSKSSGAVPNSNTLRQSGDPLRVAARAARKIFLSGPRTAGDHDDVLQRRLTRAGFTCVRKDDLVDSDELQRELDAILQRVDAIVVVWGPNSVRSSAVKSEALAGLEANKLLQLYRSDLDPRDIPMPFNALPAVSFDDEQEIVDALDRIVGLTDESMSGHQQALITYVHADRAHAIAVHDWLRARGLRVALVDDFERGTKVATMQSLAALEQRAAAGSRVIILLSSAWQASLAAQALLDHLVRLNAQIVPLVVEPTISVQSLPPSLAAWARLDLTREPRDARVTVPATVDSDWQVIRYSSDALARLEDAVSGSGPSNIAKPSHVAPADSVLTQIYFVTDRKPTGRKSPSQMFGAVGTDTPSYGVATVSIPAHRMIGSFPRDQSDQESLLRRVPTRTHFDLRGIDIFSGEAGLARDLARSGTVSDVLIFVPGFGTSFANSVMRAAQMTADIGLKGTAVALSWAAPSQSYLAARAAIFVPARAEELLRLIDLQARLPGLRKVHLLAHGLSCDLVLRALTMYPTASATLSNIIFAAPDVETERFVGAVQSLQRRSLRITAYVSKKDKALRAAALLRATSRAGSAPEALSTTGIDVIDISLASTSLFGHEDFSFAAVRDLAELINQDLPPRMRSTLTEVRAQNHSYWSLR